MSVQFFYVMPIKIFHLLQYLHVPHKSCILPILQDCLLYTDQKIEEIIDLMIFMDALMSIIIPSSSFDFYTPKIVYTILFSLYYSTDFQIFAFVISIFPVQRIACSTCSNFICTLLVSVFTSTNEKLIFCQFTFSLWTVHFGYFVNGRHPYINEKVHCSNVLITGIVM